MKQHAKPKVVITLRPRLCGDNLLYHEQASSEESF